MSEYRQRAPKLAFRLSGNTAFGYLLFSLLAALFVQGVTASIGLSLDTVVAQETTTTQRQGLRLAILLGNLLPFAGTAFFACWLTFRAGGWAATGLRRWQFPGLLGPAVGLFMAAVPLVVWLAWLNLQIPLPEWATASEATTNRLTGILLKMTTPAEFGMALVTIALVPALGEELLYRAVLQQGVLLRWLSNHHVAIWLAAAIFSGAHFEFAGFLPRMLLGGALGYAAFWTGSILLPIILHAVFNGSQVAVAYITGNFQPDTAMENSPGWWTGLAGLLLFILLWRIGESRYAALAKK